MKLKSPSLFLLSLFSFGVAHAVVPAGSQITNVALAEYTTPEGVKLTAYSNKVSLTVKQVAGVDLPDVSTVAAVPADTVYIPYTLTNTGNGEDTFILEFQNLSGDDGDLIDPVIYIDKNNDGVIDSGDEPLGTSGRVTLKPGETVHLLVAGQVPPLPDDSSILVNLSAQSTFDPAVKDEDNTVEITVKQDVVLQGQLKVDKEEIEPGEEVELTLTYINKGEVAVPGKNVFFDENGDNVPETQLGTLVYIEVPTGFTFQEAVELPPDAILVFKGTEDGYWKTSPDAVNGDLAAVGVFIPDEGTGTILPNQSGIFSVRLKSANDLPSDYYNFDGKIEFGPPESPQTYQTNTVSVFVKPTFDLDLVPEKIVKDAGSGAWITFNHTVYYTGNVENLINVYVDKENLKNFPEGAAVYVYYPDGAPLTDTNGDGLPDIGVRKPGESQPVVVKVYLPPGSFENIEIPLVAEIPNTDKIATALDIISKAVYVDTQVKATVKVSADAKESVPLAEAPLYLYEYDADKKLVSKKLLFTDEEGRIVMDEEGNVVNLYNLLREGYYYRITPSEPINNYPYTLSPYFKKDYFDSVQPGQQICWNAMGEVVSCDEPDVALKIIVDKNGNRTVVLNLDPAGYVYSATTGELINGACVYLYRCSDQTCDSYSLVPPERLDFYPDGATPEENPQVSGPTDGEGNDVGKSDGGFVFVINNFTESDVGWYFVEVDYNCSLPAADPSLAKEYLPVTLQKDKVWNPDLNTPYRGEKFYIDENFPLTPGATGMRIPLVPVGLKPLVVKKSVNTSFAEIGDYVKWTVTVNNPNDFTVYDVEVTDVLPRPVRYKSGSTKIDGEKAKDPQISKDGRTLTWLVGNLDPGQTKKITFYSIITAGADFGRYKNIAFAKGWTDPAHSVDVGSNEAAAYIKLSKGVFTDKTYILGTVFADRNENGVWDEGEEPLSNVRLYLEDGRYVLTDEEGKFHFDNVNPGVHVLRIDESSLPAGARPNFRVLQSYGSPNSVMVDLYPGDVYRINVPVVVKGAVGDKRVFKVIRSVPDIKRDAVTKSVYLVNSLTLENTVEDAFYNLQIKECNTAKPVEGTVTLNGAPFDNPSVSGNCFKWKLPIVLPLESVNLSWYSQIEPFPGEYPYIEISYETVNGLRKTEKFAIPVWIYQGKDGYVLLFNENLKDEKEKIRIFMNSFGYLLRDETLTTLVIKGAKDEDFIKFISDLLKANYIDPDKVQWQ